MDEKECDMCGAEQYAGYANDHGWQSIYLGDFCPKCWKKLTAWLDSIRKENKMDKHIW